VKLFGADSPDLRLSASGGGRLAIMGDALPGDRGSFEARVTGAREGSQLLVLRDGRVISTVPVAGGDFTHRFDATERGDYRLQVQRGSTIDSLSNPISLGSPLRPAPAGAGAGSGRAQTLVVRSRVKRARVGARKRFTFKVRTRKGARMGGVLVRFNGRRAVTDARGVARMTTRLRKRRVHRATATLRGYRGGKTRVRALRRR
jgi:hypothetical protein